MRINVSRGLAAAVLVALALTVTSCGGGGDDGGCDTPTVDVSGNWQGTWQSDQGPFGGSVAFVNLDQEGSDVTGQFGITGGDFFQADLFGEVCDDELSGSAGGDGFECRISATVSADETTMTGRYDCSGPEDDDEGSFEVRREG